MHTHMSIIIIIIIVINVIGVTWNTCAPVQFWWSLCKKIKVRGAISPSYFALSSLPDGKLIVWKIEILVNIFHWHWHRRFFAAAAAGKCTYKNCHNWYRKTHERRYVRTTNFSIHIARVSTKKVFQILIIDFTFWKSKNKHFRETSARPKRLDYVTRAYDGTTMEQPQIFYNTIGGFSFAFTQIATLVEVRSRKSNEMCVQRQTRQRHCLHIWIK